MAQRLILPTLLRQSELMLARWEQVDVEKAEWQIPAEHSKTGKPHLVFLSPQALAMKSSAKLVLRPKQEVVLCLLRDHGSMTPAAL